MHSNSSYPRLCSPVLRAWIIIIAWWPLGDILRKWGGLNQPVYVLQLLTPFLLLIYLLNKRAWSFRRIVAAPALVLTLITGVIALYYSFTEYSLAYLGVWLLSLSALLGPPLLFCTISSALKGDHKALRQTTRSFIVFVSCLFFLNNLLSILQSVLGRSHFLSVGAGCAIDAQIRTNTAIELRAPGFFTFATGNAAFSVICMVFLLASLGYRAGLRVNLIRMLAFLSLPIALARSISRLFLFSLLVILLPFSRLLLRPKTAISILISFFVFFILLFVSPRTQNLFQDGLSHLEELSSRHYV